MTGKKRVVKKDKEIEQEESTEIEHEIIEPIIEPEVEPAPIIEPEKPQGPVLGDLQIGRIFRLNGKMYKKINHGAQSRVQDVTASDSDTFLMDSSTPVLPWTAGHEVEGEM
ncbi:MAG: hypothetical protein WAO71_03565 [Gallionella sp.]